MALPVVAGTAHATDGRTYRLAENSGGPVTRLEVDSEHNSLWKSPRFGLNVAVQRWLHAR